MSRLTHPRNSGIKTGYWSPEKKDVLIERLAAYEDTGLEPDEVEEMLDIRKQKKVFKINPLVGKWEKYECPNCGCGLTDTDVFAGHCKWCGQALKL